MAVRALRAATTIDVDEVEQVVGRTDELLTEVMACNGLSSDDLISIVFSVTPDIGSIAPAAAVRAKGIVDVPLLCLQEMVVGGSLPLCIRMLTHVETERSRAELRHVYLHGAVGLRPDLAQHDPAGNAAAYADAVANDDER